MRSNRRTNIIQLASYRGNFGDIANISGTRKLLKENLTKEIHFKDLEYLEYEPDPRWGGKKFDLDFANLVNQQDLLLIGGGGLFELAVDRSCSATPLDIPFDVLERIKIPVVFHAVGFHVEYGITEERVQKFKKYMDFLLSSEKILVSLRNDGSLNILSKLYGEEYVSKVYRCPDGGFFTNSKRYHHIEMPQEKRIIAIQLGGDAIKLRFSNKKVYYNGIDILERENSRYSKPDDSIDAQKEYNKFLSGLSAVCNDLFKTDKNYHVILVPHIPEDFGIINDFIRHIGPPYSRKNITVAPYIHGKEAQYYFCDLYYKSDLVVGMRFHANVCAIGLNTPTVGLVTFAKIEGLYKELNLRERALNINDEKFEEKLSFLIKTSLQNSKKIKETYKQVVGKVQQEVNIFHNRIDTLLENFAK